MSSLLAPCCRFERVQHEKCLMDRTVSLCWGAFEDRFGTCVPAPSVGAASSAKLKMSRRSDIPLPLDLELLWTARQPTAVLSS